MTNFLGGGSARVNQPPTPQPGLRIQSAVAGQPIAIVHGKQRIACNLIDYAGFTATPVSAPSSSGKGGITGSGGKGSPTKSYAYSVDFLAGLCEGPVADVLMAWSGKSATTLGSLNLTAFAGAVGQRVWPFMASAYPARALGYSGFAYVGADPISLGSSAELPNLNFEVRGGVSAAVTEIATISSGAGYAVTAASFSLASAVTEQVTVPALAPYQVQAQNWSAPSSSSVMLGAVNGAYIIGSTSRGVVYTDTGVPLTPVAANPGAGQYTVITDGVNSTAGIYTFSAADAGAALTIIDFAVSPGVNYIETATGNLTAGAALVTGLSSTTNIAAGYPVAGAGVPDGTVVKAIGGGSSFTGNVTTGSAIITNVSAIDGVAVDLPISDSAGAVPAGATVVAITPNEVTLQTAYPYSSAMQASLIFQATGENSDLSFEGATAVGPTITLFGDPSSIAVGQAVTTVSLPVIPAGTTVTDIAGNTISLSASIPVSFVGAFVFSVTTAGDLADGSVAITNIADAAGLVAGMVLATAAAVPVAIPVLSVTEGSVTLSTPATASVSNDDFSIPVSLVMSQPASVNGTDVALTFIQDRFTQVLGSPAQGQFSVSVQPGAYGQYQFSAADAGCSVIIIDVPDADPAASLVDFLSNPRYGCGFPAANIGDLTLLQDYAYAAGLFISPAVVASQAANSYLNDFATGLNGEFVWSQGLLTFVPYGDQALAGNGRSYTPPAAAGPLYALDDDDYLPNEGTSSVGVSAFTSDDPVVCVRKRPSDALNDVKVEYLDRGNGYNPAIVEAQDDAAVNLFGLKPADTRQLHFFCSEMAALQSAQLQLGRQQVRNQYSFTVPWYFILLDPMDVIVISDEALGLDGQLVRLLEITENQQDWSLTFTVEEVLDGTGSTPRYSSQPKAGHAPNYNIDPGAAAAPVILEPPLQLSQSGGPEVWLLTGGGANYGGADVYVSSDGETYKRAGRISGGSSRIGAVTADFPSGPDPDTSHTLAVDLGAVGGQLLSGTKADADLGHTLCAVSGYAYAPAPVLSSVPGGSLAATLYYVRGTYVFPGGEGPPSPEESFACAVAERLTVSAPAPAPGAIGWNLYIGTAPGAEEKQNATPLMPGAGWIEPASGLVAGAPPPVAETGYELVSYQTATLAAAGSYRLGTYLRRGQYGTTITDHPAGASFARLDGTQFAYPYDRSQIGRTIFFKLTPFNLWGGGEGGLDTTPAYAYTIEGPPPPATVAGFGAAQNGNVVYFIWDAVESAGLAGYDIGFAPWGTTDPALFTLITEAGAGTEMTTAKVPPGTWTFAIWAVNAAGIRSLAASFFNLVIVNTGNDIYDHAEEPAWSGTRDGFLAHYTGVLIPDSTKPPSDLTNAALFTSFCPYPAASCSYTTAPIDVGYDESFNVFCSEAGALGPGQLGSFALGFAVDSWLTGGSDPDTFTTWTSGFVTLRYLRARLTLAPVAGAVPVITDFTPQISS